MGGWVEAAAHHGNGGKHENEGSTQETKPRCLVRRLIAPCREGDGAEKGRHVRYMNRRPDVEITPTLLMRDL